MNSFCSKKKRGFTLVETMVAVTVGTLSTVLILAVYMSISTSLAASADYREMHHEIRHALDLLRRDVNGGSEVLHYIAASSLEMTTTSGSTTNTVSYTLAGNQFSRIENSDTNVLATGVEQVLFTLYDAAGTVTVNPADASSVGLKIEVERQGVRNTYEDVLETRNQMRRKGL